MVQQRVKQLTDPVITGGERKYAKGAENTKSGIYRLGHWKTDYILATNSHAMLASSELSSEWVAETGTFAKAERDFFESSCSQHPVEVNLEKHSVNARAVQAGLQAHVYLPEYLLKRNTSSEPTLYTGFKFWRVI